MELSDIWEDCSEGVVAIQTFDALSECMDNDI